MKITHTMIVMLVGSFLIQYLLMPPIMVSNSIYITNSLGKAYMAFIMAIFMLFLEVMMHDYQYKVFSINLYTLLAFGLLLFIYLYRNQVKINDKQYLEEMFIRQVLVDENEADDLISFYCQIAENEKITIFSGDRDLTQLISENVSIYSPNTKNLLNRLKEQMKHSIVFLSNKFNTNLSTDTLI